VSGPVPPVLRADAARIAVDDVVALDGLSLSTIGERVVCVGDTQALLSAIMGVPLDSRAREDADEPRGEARVAGGALLVAGRDVDAGDHYDVIGAAPLDPPIPATWTLLEYVSWSARLGGVPKREARDLAAAALDRSGLARAASKRVSVLSKAERRVLSFAAAIAAAPAVLVAERPLDGLDEASAGFVLRSLANVAEGRGAIVTVGRLSPSAPEGALARGATHLVVLSQGRLVIDGSPADVLMAGSLYALTVRTNAERLRAELAARGIDVRGGPQRFSLTLPVGTTTRDILAAASAARAAVVELSPMF
jgi:ABC-2 type transport system ATP-binding protein